MLFGFINALITFQTYVHKALAGLLDIIYIAYLNDILIFSRTEKESSRPPRGTFGEISPSGCANCHDVERHGTVQESTH